MAHKKHRGDFKDEDEDEEESEAEEEDDEETDEDDEETIEEKKPVKKETSKPSSKSASKPTKPIKLELVQAPKTYEDAIQFEDGTYVKLNDTDFRVWVVNTLLEIKEAIG